MNDMRQIVVVGAGFMGKWITAGLARHSGAETSHNLGHPPTPARVPAQVTLIDIDPNALHGARQHINDWATQNSWTFPAPIHFECRPKDSLLGLEDIFRGAHVVIEALPEQQDMKRELFRQLDGVCNPHCLICSNSSSFMMTELDEPFQGLHGRTMNTHFFPYPRDSVEIMAGTGTTLETVQSTAALFGSYGFKPFVVAKPSRGFIFNRIWRAVKREVLKVIAEGVSTPEDVDALFRSNFAMPLGPCEIMDMVGLDVVLQIEMVYAEASGNPDDLPPQFLIDMVNADKLGRKTGEGFYKY